MQASSVVNPHATTTWIRGRSRSNTWTNGGRDRTRAFKTYREKQSYLSFPALDSENGASLSQLQLQSEQLQHHMEQLKADLSRLLETHQTLDGFDNEFKHFKKDYQNYFPWRAKHPLHTRREIPEELTNRHTQLIWQRGEPNAAGLKDHLASLKGRVEQFSTSCFQKPDSLKELDRKLCDFFSNARSSLNDDDLNRFLHEQRLLIWYGRIMHRLSPNERINNILKRIKNLQATCEADCLRYFQEEEAYQGMGNAEVFGNLGPNFTSVIAQTINQRALHQSTHNFSAAAL